MKLAKLVVAIGISLVLVSLISSMLSTFFKAPKIDTQKCYGTSTCYNTLKSMCDSTNYTCLSGIYSSQAYRDCEADRTADRQRCIENAGNAMIIYQTIYFLIVAVLGIFLVSIGFLIISKESIGGGLIGGGILTILSSSLLASVSTITSTLSSLSSISLVTGSAGTSKSISPLPYLNIVFLLITLVVLILFAYFKLEKTEK